MKCSDLESKAKQSGPPHFHPPESALISPADLLSRWLQDKETFQVILDLYVKYLYILLLVRLFLVLLRFRNSSLLQNKIQFKRLFFSFILQHLSLAHHPDSSVPYRLRLEWLGVISATTSSWMPLCIRHHQTWVSTSCGKILSSHSTSSGRPQRCDPVWS